MVSQVALSAHLGSLKNTETLVSGITPPDAYTSFIAQLEQARRYYAEKWGPLLERISQSTFDLQVVKSIQERLMTQANNVK